MRTRYIRGQHAARRHQPAHPQLKLLADGDQHFFAFGQPLNAHFSIQHLVDVAEQLDHGRLVADRDCCSAGHTLRERVGQAERWSNMERDEDRNFVDRDAKCSGHAAVGSRCRAWQHVGNIKLNIRRRFGFCGISGRFVQSINHHCEHGKRVAHSLQQHNGRATRHRLPWTCVWRIDCHDSGRQLIPAPQVQDRNVIRQRGIARFDELNSARAGLKCLALVLDKSLVLLAGRTGWLRDWRPLKRFCPQLERVGRLDMCVLCIWRSFNEFLVCKCSSLCCP